jgi:hypothetical protein
MYDAGTTSSLHPHSHQEYTQYATLLMLTHILCILKNFSLMMLYTTFIMIRSKSKVKEQKHTTHIYMNNTIVIGVPTSLISLLLRW